MLKYLNNLIKRILRLFQQPRETEILCEEEQVNNWILFCAERCRCTNNGIPLSKERLFFLLNKHLNKLKFHT